jgi:hypothetical protein
MVIIYDVYERHQKLGKTGERAFIVMEYCKLGDAFDQLRGPENKL